MWIFELFWAVFKIYLEFLWPPHAYLFIKNWQKPMHGQGMGPGFYRLFLPVMFLCWFCAIATYASVAVGLFYLISSLV